MEEREDASRKIKRTGAFLPTARRLHILGHYQHRYNGTGNGSGSEACPKIWRLQPQQMTKTHHLVGNARDTRIRQLEHQRQVTIFSSDFGQLVATNERTNELPGEPRRSGWLVLLGEVVS